MYKSEIAPYNSIKTIIALLEKYNFLTEDQICKWAFGYDRKNSRESNKKYAYMIRRGLEKGILARVEKKPSLYDKGSGNVSRFYYYLPFRPIKDLPKTRIYS